MLDFTSFFMVFTPGIPGSEKSPPAEAEPSLKRWPGLPGQRYSKRKVAII